MRKPKTGQLTIEQLSETYDISVNEVNNIIDGAYNKIIDSLIKDNIDPWDAVVSVKEYFNMTEKDAVEKLSNKNRLLLKDSAKNRNNANIQTHT
jgi:hypothetical protein